jgi:hypothetical protein
VLAETQVDHRGVDTDRDDEEDLAVGPIG